VTKRRTKAPAKRKRASRASGRATYLARLRAGEAHVLELVAAGVPLSQTLDALARTFEARPMAAGVDPARRDGARVRHAAAPASPRARAGPRRDSGPRRPRVALATVAIQHHRHQETILESESRADLSSTRLDANVLMTARAS